MPSTSLENSFTLIGAEKDALVLALQGAPDGREKSGILTSLVRAGMADGRLALSNQQAGYLIRELPRAMESEQVRGTKIDSDVGKLIIANLSKKLIAALPGPH